MIVRCLSGMIGLVIYIYMHRSVVTFARAAKVQCGSLAVVQSPSVAVFSLALVPPRHMTMDPKLTGPCHV